MSQLPKEVAEIRQTFLYLSNLTPSLSALITLGYFQFPSYTVVGPKPLVHHLSVSRLFFPILQISVDFSLSPWSLSRISRQLCPADCVQFIVLWVSLHSTYYCLVWIWALLVCIPLLKGREFLSSSCFEGTIIFLPITWCLTHSTHISFSSARPQVF